MPEKCASAGYSNGCVRFVQVLLMITVYSASAVGAAGGAGRAAAGALFDPFPQAMTRTGAIRYSERRARMTVSITRKGFPSERVEYRTPSLGGGLLVARVVRVVQVGDGERPLTAHLHDRHTT